MPHSIFKPKDNWKHLRVLFNRTISSHLTEEDSAIYKLIVFYCLIPTPSKILRSLGFLAFKMRAPPLSLFSLLQPQTNQKEKEKKKTVTDKKVDNWALSLISTFSYISTSTKLCEREPTYQNCKGCRWNTFSYYHLLGLFSKPTLLHIVYKLLSYMIYENLSQQPIQTTHRTDRARTFQFH